MKNLIPVFFLLLLFSAGSCNRSSKQVNDVDSWSFFAIHYSCSQGSNYSYDITINKDSIWFEEKNSFWNKVNKQEGQLPRIKVCRLSKAEIHKLKIRILKANVFKLENLYGVFDGNFMNQYSILHVFSININNSVKYITLRNAKDNEPSTDFIYMLQYLVELREKYDTDYGKQ